MGTEKNDEDTLNPQTETADVKDNLDEDSSSLDEKGNKSQVNLELLLDMPVDLEIELGRKRVMLEKVLELETGTILTLDKTADDPINLYVNGTLIATGMLITIDEEDTLGFQVTSIVDRNKRIRSLEERY